MAQKAAMGKAFKSCKMGHTFKGDSCSKGWKAEYFVSGLKGRRRHPLYYWYLFTAHKPLFYAEDE